MSFKGSARNMVTTNSKTKVLSCSTPEQPDSPSRDSDSIYDSDAASPVPFLCTQDGAEGETDVVWNFYTPKSEHLSKASSKSSTPLTRKSRKIMKPKIIDKPVPRKRGLRNSLKKKELFQDLLELNQNIHQFISQKTSKCLPSEKQASGSEEDIFNEPGGSSPKSCQKSNSRCLRRNVLSSKFTKLEPETALDSDDSMNEYLLKASQVVEEKILNSEEVPLKKPRYNRSSKKNPKTNDSNFKLDQDSMDAIISSFTLDSPVMKKVKSIDSPRLNNDSFDNIFGNLNDSTFEQLTQVPVKSSANGNFFKDDLAVREVKIHDSSIISKSPFGRFNSMPESPSVPNLSKPSTSTVAFGRYNSMPYNQNQSASSESGDSPIRCTPEEIKKKHQLARERLLAKRQLPFTSTQSNSSQLAKSQLPPKSKFKPKVPTTISRSAAVSTTNSTELSTTINSKINSDTVDLKLIIEKKRQEALMKLRRKQPLNRNV